MGDKASGDKNGCKTIPYIIAVKYIVNNTHNTYYIVLYYIMRKHARNHTRTCTSHLAHAPGSSYTPTHTRTYTRASALCAYSPVILRPGKGQPQTNCNSKFEGIFIFYIMFVLPEKSPPKSIWRNFDIFTRW